MTATKKTAGERPAEKVPEKTGTESLYTAAELAANAHLFGVRPEMVTAALGGIEKTTQREAAKLVEAFRKKEVK